MKPGSFSMRSLSRRVAELARRAEIEQERFRGEAQRAEGIRILMDPEALEASLELSDWVYARQGVDERPHVRGEAPPMEIARWLEDDPAAAAMLERCLPPLRRAMEARPCSEGVP